MNPYFVCPYIKVLLLFCNPNFMGLACILMVLYIPNNSSLEPPTIILLLYGENITHLSILRRLLFVTKNNTILKEGCAKNHSIANPNQFISIAIPNQFVSFRIDPNGFLEVRQCSLGILSNKLNGLVWLVNWILSNRR